MTSVVYDKAFQNLQIFVEHNQDISPSLYRLDVADGHLISFQTCGLMRLVELICTYIADAFRSIFCCCDCTDTRRSEKQELIRTTLRESVQTLTDAVIQREQLQAFNDLAAAFNRITESMRNEETTCCMNGLYNKTGWSLGEDIQNLTLQNPALPRPPAAPQQQSGNSDSREIDNSSQQESVPPSGPESSSTQPTIIEEIFDEEDLEENQQETSTETAAPPPAPPASLPKSAPPKQPPAATSKQPPSTARPPSFLSEEEQLRMALAQSEREALMQQNLSDLLHTFPSPTPKSTGSKQPPAATSFKAAPLSNRNVTQVNTAQQPPLAGLSDDEQLRLAMEASLAMTVNNSPQQEEDSDPELAEAYRRSLAESTRPDASPKVAETPQVITTPPEIAVDNVYLPFSSENIQSILTATISEEYINQLKTTAQRMDGFAYHDNKLNSYLESDQNLVNLSLASGVELLNHEKTLNDFYECFKSSKNPYPSIREARGLVWARVVRPILEAYETLRQDKNKDVDQVVADKRASARTDGHRNQYINKYVGLMEDIFLAAGKEILKNEFKGAPLSESAQSIKDLMIYMINDAGNDLKRVALPQDADSADAAPKDVDLEAKTQSFIILGQLPKNK